MMMSDGCRCRDWTRGGDSGVSHRALVVSRPSDVCSRIFTIDTALFALSPHFGLSESSQSIFYSTFLPYFTYTFHFPELTYLVFSLANSVLYIVSAYCYRSFCTS